MSSLPALQANYTKPQEDARKYIEQHDLHHFFTLLLNQVVQTKPSLPKVFMIKMIAERCTLEQLSEAGISVKGHGATTKSPAERHAAAQEERDAPAVDQLGAPLGADTGSETRSEERKLQDESSLGGYPGAGSGTERSKAPSKESVFGHRESATSERSPAFEEGARDSTFTIDDDFGNELKSDGGLSEAAPDHAFKKVEDDDVDNQKPPSGEDLTSQPAPDVPEARDVPDGSPDVDGPQEFVQEVNDVEGGPEAAVEQAEDVGVDASDDAQADGADAPLPPPTGLPLEEAEQDPEQDCQDDPAPEGEPHTEDIKGDSATEEPTSVDERASDTAIVSADQMPAQMQTAHEEKEEKAEDAKATDALDLVAEAQDTAPTGDTQVQQEEEKAPGEDGESTNPQVVEPTEVDAADEEQSSATLSSWASVRTFRDLCSLVEDGVPLPEQGPRVGGPLWLADILAKDGSDPIISRLEWLIQQTSIELLGPTSTGVDLAMALAQSLGAGPWLQWLYSHSVCQEGATDSSGRTVESYVEDFEMINGSLGCLNLSGQEDPEMAKDVEDASAAAEKDATAP